MSLIELDEIEALLLERLAGVGIEDMRVTGDGVHRGPCPHCGKSDRFVIGPYDDERGYWIKCFAHCEKQDILTVLELGWRDLLVDGGEDVDPERLSSLRPPDLGAVRPTLWVWKQRIPIAKTSLFVGNEGCGKGVTIAYIAAQVSRGTLEGDLRGIPSTTLVIGDEDSIGDWTARLHVAGADFDFVRFQVEGDTDIDFTDPGDVEHLRALIQLCGARLVVFDALLDHVGGAGVDEYKPKAVRLALRPLRRIALEEQVAMLGAMHPRKGRVLTFRDLVANSHQFNAVSRSSLLLAHHPEDQHRRVLAWGKGNYAGGVPTLTFRIEEKVFVSPRGEQLGAPCAVDWEQSELTVEDAVNASTGGRPAGPSKEELAQDAICEALADGPRASAEAKAEVIERLGCGLSTVDRAATELRLTGVLITIGSTRDTRWDLAEHQFAPRSHPKSGGANRENGKSPVDTGDSANSQFAPPNSAQERGANQNDVSEQAPLPLEEAASENGAGVRERAEARLRRFQQDQGA